MDAQKLQRHYGFRFAPVPPLPPPGCRCSTRKGLYSLLAASVMAIVNFITLTWSAPFCSLMNSGRQQMSCSFSQHVRNDLCN